MALRCVLAFVAAVGAQGQVATCQKDDAKCSVPGISLLQHSVDSGVVVMDDELHQDGNAYNQSSSPEVAPSVTPPSYSHAGVTSTHQLPDEMFMIAMQQSRVAFDTRKKQRDAVRGVESFNHTRSQSASLADLPFPLPFSKSNYKHGPLIMKDETENTAAVLFWDIDDKSNTIKLGMATNSKFLAFGMSLFGPTLPGADVVICGKKDGIIALSDWYGTDYTMIVEDHHQDWTTTLAGREPASPPAGYPSPVCPIPGAKLLPDRFAYGQTLCGDLHASWGSMRSYFPPKFEGGPNQVEAACCTEVTGVADDARFCDEEWHLKPDASVHGNNCGVLQTHCYGVEGGCGKDMGLWAKPSCCDASKKQPHYLNAAPTVGSMADVTWCEGTRKLKTCHNTMEDFEIEDPTMVFDSYWVWPEAGWIKDDPREGMVYPGGWGFGFNRRHTAPFAFLENPPPADGRQGVFELVAPVVQVPFGGSHVCSYHTLPLANIARKKYHIIEFTVEQSGPAQAAGVQHHVSLLACTEPLSFGVSNQLLPENGNCFNKDIMTKCRTSLLNMARAGRPLPGHVGKPIGGKGGIVHTVLLRHFYNGDNHVVNDVGTKFVVTYTPQLRGNDEIELVLSRGQFYLPSGKGTVGVGCPGVARSNHNGNTLITNVQFHMHGAGKSAILRVYDRNAEMRPIAAFPMWKEGPGNIAVKRLLKGSDGLRLECTYDADYPVLEGESAGQEMCTATLTLEVPRKKHFPSIGNCHQNQADADNNRIWVNEREVSTDFSGRTPFQFDNAACLKELMKAALS